MLNRDLLTILTGNTYIFRKENSIHFIVMERKDTVARISIRILGATGYFSLFECIDDKKAFKLLFESVSDWLRKRRAVSIFELRFEIAYGGDVAEGNRKIINAILKLGGEKWKSSRIYAKEIFLTIPLVLLKCLYVNCFYF